MEDRIYRDPKDEIAQQDGEMWEVSCGWKVVYRKDPGRKWRGTKALLVILMCLEWIVRIMGNFLTEEEKIESEFCI